VKEINHQNPEFQWCLYRVPLWRNSAWIHGASMFDQAMWFLHCTERISSTHLWSFAFFIWPSYGQNLALYAI